MSLQVQSISWSQLAPEMSTPPTILTDEDVEKLATAPINSAFVSEYGHNNLLINIGPWRLTYYTWTEIRGSVIGYSSEGGVFRTLPGEHAIVLFCKALSRLKTTDPVHIAATQHGLKAISWSTRY